MHSILGKQDRESLGTRLEQAYIPKTPLAVSQNDTLDALAFAQ